MKQITQTDPREFDEELQYYDTLLFQMDSEYSDEKSDYEILWGDVGVANFFINKEDLKKKDFSKVMYTWDCCYVYKYVEKNRYNVCVWKMIERKKLRN